jgi:hypothetical protein
MPMTETATLYCYVHPNRPTVLRCNRCERPICTQCAVRVPTGYRCRNCVRELEKTFETAAWVDYLVGLLTTTLLSLLASALISALSFFSGFFLWFIVFALAAGAGSIISNITLRAIRKHRSRALFIVTSAGVVLGALPIVIFMLLTGNIFSLISQGIYVFVATPAVYAGISGIRFFR